MGGVPKRVETAEKRYRGADANVGLAEVGEDGENEDGIWVEVKELDLVHFKDGQKEIGEWGDKTGLQGVDEDGVESLGEPAAGRPHLGDAVLIGARRH